MKSTKAIAAILATLVLAGCYWVPSEAEAGGVALTLSVPRTVLPGYVGHSLRAYLHNSSEISARYFNWMSYAFYPAPLAADDEIELTITGSPIPIDGYEYLEIGLGDPADTPAEGSFTIPDVVAGKKYRLRVQWAYRNPMSLDYDFYEGVSDTFEVSSGSVVDLAIDLYYPYGGGFC